MPNKIRQIQFPETWSLRGVQVWGPKGVSSAQDLVFQGGVLKSMSPSASPAKGGVAVLPAGLDMQVHLRVPGQPEKETVQTGLAAALCGGIAGFVTMPNTRPTIDSVEVLEEAREQVSPWEKKTGVKVFFSAALSYGQRGQKIVDVEALAKAGIVAFTDDGVGLESDSLMEEAFRRLAPLGLPLFQHAETPGHGGVLAPGTVQERLGLAPYSSEPELTMVRRDLDVLQRVPKAKYHLLHVSSGDTLTMISGARQRGLQVTVEVSPHHLWFTSEDVEPRNAAFKMNPPLRSEKDRRSLEEALEEGEIDWVATDHAPHEAIAKTKDFKKASFGTVGLETCLPVLLALHARGKLTRERLVQVFSTAPARYLGLTAQQGWGEITPGAPAKLVLIDTEEKWHEWQAEDFHSLSKNSCFIGSELPSGPLLHVTESGIFALSDRVEIKNGEITIK